MHVRLCPRWHLHAAGARGEIDRMSRLWRAPVPSRPSAPEHIGGAQSGRPDGKDGSSVLEARSERGRVPGRSSRSAGLPTRSVAAQLQVHRSAGHATVGGTRERVRSGACPRGVAGAGRGVAPGRLGRVELAFEASGRVTSPTEVWERRRKSGRLPTPQGSIGWGRLKVGRNCGRIRCLSPALPGKWQLAPHP